MYREMKICLHNDGHKTKMAAMPIFVKNPSNISPKTFDQFPRNLVCSIGGLLPIIVCSNDVPGVTLPYTTAK